MNDVTKLTKEAWTNFVSNYVKNNGIKEDDSFKLAQANLNSVFDKLDKSDGKIDGALNESQCKTFMESLKLLSELDFNGLYESFVETFSPTKDESAELKMQTTQIDNANTGGIVGVYVDDTTSYSINFNKHEITKTNGDIRTTYKMTPEQRRMSQQQLIDSLQKKTETNEYNLEMNKDVHDSDPVIYNGSDADSVKDKKVANENKKPRMGLEAELESTTEQKQPAKAVTEQTVRPITGNGINGTYTIIETPNGDYELNQNFTVSAYKNQAAQAFQKGLVSKYGTINVKPDENGQYNFRGIKAKTYSVLSMQVQQRSQQIAGYTAIYQDLQDKQNNGENLTAGEQKFMSFYNELLQKSGLQMNSNGELEDIPTSTRGRKLKN